MSFRHQLSKTAGKVDSVATRVERVKTLLEIAAEKGDYALAVERAVLALYLNVEESYIDQYIIPAIKEEGIDVGLRNNTTFRFSWEV